MIDWKHLLKEDILLKENILIARFSEDPVIDPKHSSSFERKRPFGTVPEGLAF